MAASSQFASGIDSPSSILDSLPRSRRPGCGRGDCLSADYHMILRALAGRCIARSERR